MKILFTSFFLVFQIFSGFGASFKISNLGMTFVPSTLNINAGDEVEFEIDGSHNAVQVSKTTWDGNGATPNGGFNVPFGGGKVTFSSPGTYYYVCSPHASSGMKGIITVSGVTSIADLYTENSYSFSVFPNPASDHLVLYFRVLASSDVKIELFDISGRKHKDMIASFYFQGSYSETIHLDGILPGRYFIRMIRGGQPEIMNLIIR